MILDEHGSLSTRDGYSVLSTSPDTAKPLVYRSALNRNDGTTYPFAVQNAGTTNTLWRTNTTPWTSILLTSTGYVTPQSVTVNDTEVFALGYETPRTWDGTTVGTITATGGQTVPPGAKHIAFHLGSVWLWNTNAATTTLDGPSSLRMADPNSVASWPNASQTFIAKDDGQQGMGLAAYTIVETGISPTSTLVAFKNYSAYQITGVFGASNFTVQKIKSDMGCVAPRTLQFCSGFGIVRLTHKGFALYNGVDDKLISEEVRPYIQGHDDIAALNTSVLDRASAVQSQNPPLYVAACPVTGTGLTRIFVYDLVRRAWTICDFPVAFGCLSLFLSPTALPTVHAGTATGGQILTLFSGATTDNGAPIAWSVKTRAYFLGSFMRPTYWRRAVLDFEVQRNQPVEVEMTLGGVNGAVSSGSLYGTAVYGTSPYSRASVTVNTLNGSAAVYGVGQYGIAQYGPVAVDARQTIDIHRVAPTMQLTIAGQGHVRLRGLSLHAVERKPTAVFA